MTEHHNSQPNPTFENLLTASELASILGISPKTVHKLVRERKLSCVQVTARERRFTHDQIKEYIRSQSTELRVDKKEPRPIQSPPRKGGDNTESRQEKTKDSWASLKKEMSHWT